MLFYKEYSRVVKKNLRPGNQVNLVDILVDLQFLDRFEVGDPESELCLLISKFIDNFMVYSKSGEYTGESEDIIKNLFKVLCAIMDFKLH